METAPARQQRYRVELRLNSAQEPTQVWVTGPIEAALTNLAEARAAILAKHEIRSYSVRLAP